ncbi:MucR family transcriptional regulator [Tianweitania populi]|nr:MucR family transcriptional regulator [Tianweitania populi]
MEITAQLVSAYVAKNPVPMSEFPGLIESVHTKLNALNQPASAEPAISSEKAKPAVPVKKSITPDYIISLEDGKQYKTLRRHLAKLGLSPDQYRAKWSLPADYPMVAASYAANRSMLAKKMGLGRRPKSAAEPAPVQRRSRKPKA